MCGGTDGLWCTVRALYEDVAWMAVRRRRDLLSLRGGHTGLDDGYGPWLGQRRSAGSAWWLSLFALVWPESSDSSSGAVTRNAMLEKGRQERRKERRKDKRSQKKRRHTKTCFQVGSDRGVRRAASGYRPQDVGFFHPSLQVSLPHHAQCQTVPERGYLNTSCLHQRRTGRPPNCQVLINPPMRLVPYPRREPPKGQRIVDQSLQNVDDCRAVRGVWPRPCQVQLGLGCTQDAPGSFQGRTRSRDLAFWAGVAGPFPHGMNAGLPEVPPVHRPPGLITEGRVTTHTNTKGATVLDAPGLSVPDLMKRGRHLRCHRVASFWQILTSLSRVLQPIIITQSRPYPE